MTSARVCENGHVVEGAQQFYCRRCGSVDLSPPAAEGRPRESGSAPAGTPAGDPPPGSRALQARETLRRLALWGGGLYLGASLLGALVLDSLVDNLDDVGAQRAALVVCALAATAGLVLLAVAVIGWGVRLGREATEPDR